jgi:hypothetical protein
LAIGHSNDIDFVVGPVCDVSEGLCLLCRNARPDGGQDKKNDGSKKDDRRSFHGLLQIHILCVDAQTMAFRQWLAEQKACTACKKNQKNNKYNMLTLAGLFELPNYA